MSTHTGIYGTGLGATVLLGLVWVAVITRYLDPGEFGRLAIYLTFAAFLTVGYNLGSLPGSFRWVFGSTGEEDVDDESGAARGAADKRGAMTTALALTAAVSFGCSAILAVFASQLAELLTGGAGDSEAMMLALLSAALGAVWRLTSNVLRLERRPVAFAVLSNARPVLVLAVAVPLVAGGQGAEGVLTGTALGTAGAVAATLLVTRRSYRLAIYPRDTAAIYRLGAPLIPAVFALFVITNGDIILLSRYVDDEEVGFYRVASRAAALVSYATSALFMAWSPLARTSIAAAAREEHGRAVGGKMILYFWFAAGFMAVGMTVAADELVRIAPPEYHEAAPLIPLLGLGFIMQGVMVALYRGTTFPHRRAIYVTLTVIAALIFLAASFIFIPQWGGTGAAVSVIVAFAVAAGAILAMSQLGPKPTPLAYDRMAAAAAVAVGCILVERVAAPSVGDFHPGVALLAIGAYPVLLVLLGVIPRDDVRPLVAMARALLPHKAPTRPITSIAEKLPPDEVALFERLIRFGESPREVALGQGLAEADVERDFVAALRRLDDLGEPSELDAAIGDYLLSSAPIAARDAAAKKLWKMGVDPRELDHLERLVDAVRGSLATSKVRLRVAPGATVPGQPTSHPPGRG